MLIAAAALSAVAGPVLADGGAGGGGAQDIKGGAGGKGFNGQSGGPGGSGFGKPLGGGGGGGAGGGAGGAGASEFLSHAGSGGPGGANGNGLGATSLSNVSPLDGGDGGAGGSAFALGIAGSGGGGGAGGYGAIVTGGGPSGNSSSISGGNGGGGGDSSGGRFLADEPYTRGGGGGDGGGGIYFTTSGVALTNSGIIAAGAGGAGGNGDGTHTAGGNGGNGGVAVEFAMPGNAVTNTGSILGGNGAAGGSGGWIGGWSGQNGTGGAGVIGSDLTIVNSGTISGGLGGDGTTRANAITFGSGANVLELHVGSTIVGNVVAQGDATLRFGGAGVGNFDVSQIGGPAQYQGFGSFEKVGTSTWILTGATSLAMPWTISSGTLAIGSGSSLGASSGTLTFNGGSLRAGSSLTIRNHVSLGTGGGTLEIGGDEVIAAGAISGSGGLTKRGLGTLTLAAGNSYTGGTTVLEGVLKGDSSSLQGNIANDATVVFDQAFGGTYSAVISGTGSLTKRGLGALTLTGANSHTGGTTVLEGVLQGDSNSLQGNIVNDAAVVFDQAFGGTYSAIISGAGSLTKRGSGTLTLAGANSYTGGTTVLEGVLQGDATSLRGDINNDAKVAFGEIATGTYAGKMSGTGSLVKQLGGTLILTGANSYSGRTEIHAGTLQVGTGGTLGSGDVANEGNMIFNASGTSIVAGSISGTGVVEQRGNGTTILAAANSYSGGTAVTNGTLQIGNRGASGSIIGNVALSDGTTLAFDRTGTLVYADAASGAGQLVKNGAGRLILTGANTYGGGTIVNDGVLQIGNGGTTGWLDGNIVNNSVVSFNRSDDVVFAGNITGTGAVAFAGSGTVTLTGTNTFAAGTVLDSGTLILDRNDALAAGSGFTIYGGRLELMSFSQTFGVLSGSGGAIDLGSGSLTAGDGTDRTLDTSISGSGTFIKQGSGTLSLTAASTNTGLMTVAAGTLQVGNGGTTGSLLANVAVAGGATLAFDRADTLAYAGSASGIGGLQQRGTGTTILTGANSYSGTTTIAAGTLQVGNGGSTGSLGTGTVANNATLAFNLSIYATVANPISGSGALVQSGSGTLNLTGANTYSGPTTVRSGRLAVNGSIASSVTVEAGGDLGGSGFIAGSVVNNGMLSPGNSIGTLTVSGTYTQAPGSTYQVEVNAQGQGDRINVTGAPGTATLNGGTVAVVAATGMYAPKQTYTILNATGGITGAFSSVTSNFAFLTPSLAYDANNVFLTLELGGFSRGAQTPNQKAVATALDKVVSGAAGDLATVLGTIAALDTVQGPMALDAISGQQYSGQATGSLAAGLTFMNTIGQQLMMARSGGGGVRVPLAEACDFSFAEACDAAGASPWSAWAAGMGTAGSILGSTGAATLTYSAGGVAAGIDYRFSPSFLAGIGVGYVSGNQWFAGLTGRGSTGSYQSALYASYVAGGFYVDAVGGYAYNDTQMTRPISIPGLAARIATGRTGASQLLGQVEAGYRISLDDAATAGITPFVRFQAMTLNQAAFMESGASSLNLNVAQQTTNSTRTVLGAELEGEVGVGTNVNLGLSLRLGWSHEFDDLQRPVTASFAGAPGTNFTVYGAAPQRDAAIVGFGVEARAASGARLFLRYDGEFSSGTDSHGLKGGFILNW